MDDDRFEVLIVAPDQPGVTQHTGVNTISDWVRTQILSGPVSYLGLYNVCNSHKFRVLHFVGKLALDRNGEMAALQLSHGEILEKGQMAAILQACEAEAVFLNACDTTLLANYLVYNNLVEYAIASAAPIRDEISWEMPERFYRYIGETIDRGQRWTYADAFQTAIAPSRDGYYGLVVTPRIRVSDMILSEEFKAIKKLLVSLQETIRMELNGTTTGEASARATLAVFVAIAFSLVATAYTISILL